jgi:hypothetical protein
MILPELRYTEPNDIQMRLYNTVIRYNSRPVFVLGFGNDELHIRVHDLLSGIVHENVHTSDSDLDISSPPLGYCNLGEEAAVYVTRCPRRKQQQGFCPQHAIVYYDREPSSGFKYNTTMLGPMIAGIYPSFDEVVQRVKNSKGKKRFAASYDRYFSLYKTKDPSLMRIKHLIDDVGLYVASEGVGFILPTFKTEYRLKKKLLKHMQLVDLNGVENVDG